MLHQMVSETPMPVNPIVPQLQPQERADLLQWAESERAGYVADAIASFGFKHGSTKRLTPQDAATCLRLASLSLRSTKPEWVTAAMQHAAAECEAALDPLSKATLAAPKEYAEALTVKVLQAYLGILDGSIVLPAEVYLSISTDKVL